MAAEAKLFLDLVFVVGLPLTLLVLPVSFFGGVEIYLGEVVEQSGDHGGFLIDLDLRVGRHEALEVVVDVEGMFQQSASVAAVVTGAGGRGVPFGILASLPRRGKYGVSTGSPTQQIQKFSEKRKRAEPMQKHGLHL